MELIPEPFSLFHWSPTSRRKGILRYGLQPGMRSVDRLWKPPHICFSVSADRAWKLSGDIHPEIDSWDLWEVRSDALTGFERLFYDHDFALWTKEIRVYERVYKRDVWYIGTRAQ